MECGRHLNIEIITQARVTAIKGQEGNFTLTVRQSPGYVHADKCIACGRCSEVCPAGVPDEHDFFLSERKAIHIGYAQAVPLTYAIDHSACLRLNGQAKCRRCRQACPAGAIDFSQAEHTLRIQAGAVILAAGFVPFDPSGHAPWGYGTLANVITSPEMERLLSSCGPTRGHLQRPSDGQPVRSLAFLLCVGSRAQHGPGHAYCSSVCCMSSIKEAVLAKESSPSTEVTIYYSDLRTHGKGFERYFQHARDRHGIRFVRCRPHGVEAAPGDRIRIRTLSESGRQREDTVDMAVLSVGMVLPDESLALARTAAIQMGQERFAATSSFQPLRSSRRGIFVCGAFSGPRDISHAIEQGSAAAASAAELLHQARFSSWKRTVFPPQRPVDSTLRIGVFLCHCGGNIAENIDMDALARRTERMEQVTLVKQLLFGCSQDSRKEIIAEIERLGLNRVVIAACSPRSHEELFRTTLREAGLNGHLLEMANLRHQVAWVHGHDRQAATRKAADLVRMATAALRDRFPVRGEKIPVKPSALVIGGGVAGMTAALNLAGQGFSVELVEKSDRLGGNALNLNRTWNGEQVPPFVRRLTEQVNDHPGITVHLSSEVISVSGRIGQFSTTIRDRKNHRRIIGHGVTLLCTGGRRALPTEYGYAKLPQVVTALEFDALHIYGDIRVNRGTTFVFLQCVGSRDENHNYCSRVCCTHSVQSAIALKEENPERRVYILYREMRTYALRERLYHKALELGVIFINHDRFGKPQVNGHGEQVQVEVWDHVLNRPLRIIADMVILASGILPGADAADLSSLLRVTVDEDGFFQEAHPKLRPVDLPGEGLFVAGLAHGPKPLEESVCQALAAAGRAGAILARGEIQLSMLKAVVNESACDGCGLCLEACPYQAIHPVTIPGQEETRLVRVEETRCTGCGICQGSCPKKGIDVNDFTHAQLLAQIDAALEESEVRQP